MNTKEIFAHLCEVHHQLVVTSQKADEICDKFNNVWLANRIGYINGDIDNINTILPLDSAPTQNSTKGVTSGGVFTALQNAGITPRYEHNIYARVLNGTSTIGYIYYKIINEQASKFAFETPVFDTINIVTIINSI